MNRTGGLTHFPAQFVGGVQQVWHLPLGWVASSSLTRAAKRVGYPVVVKPLDANHGRGVAIRLTDAEQVESAFRDAREHSRTVIVEAFIEGFDHRMLVVDGELVVQKREAAWAERGRNRKPGGDFRNGSGMLQILTLTPLAIENLELEGRVSDTWRAERKRILEARAKAARDEAERK